MKFLSEWSINTCSKTVPSSNHAIDNTYCAHNAVISLAHDYNSLGTILPE